MQLDLSRGRAPLRRNFGRIDNPTEIPSLIELQKRSYEKFLQFDAAPDKRDNSGLQAVFKSVFPIEDFNRTASLEFDHYTFETPKYDVDECRARGMNYEAPLKITVRLVVYDVDEAGQNRTIRDIKEQEVWLGAIPLMTENASFIINGVERVIVSQLHRSPGVIFNHDGGKSHSSGKLLYTARVIPHRGSWLDFEFDHRDILYARIDRRRKFPATIVLKALGLSTEDLLNFYYKIENILITKDGTFEKEINSEVLLNQRAADNIINPKTGDVIVKKDAPIRKAEVRKITEAGIKTLPITPELAVGRVLSKDIINPKTGEVLAEVNTEITSDLLEMCKQLGIKKLPVIFTDNLTAGPYLRETLLIDGVRTQDQALIEVFKRMRPGDPPTLEAAKNLWDYMFFRSERYDLSRVGRLKINYRFPQNKVPIETTWLTKEDILETVKYLINLNNGLGSIDDIDHLGNRRVRAVGELLENQYRVGLVRMERAIKERLSIQEVESLMPHDLINQKPVSSVVKEFFGSSQLSQFMDQNNPLSEITHKRRLSALGPGGLTRERAGFDVRDVHPTHYGRICPIETPEGPNIGLISSLASFARVNEYGFIETPYHVVQDRAIKPQVKYLSAIEEENKVIAATNPECLNKGSFSDDRLFDSRKEGEYTLIQSSEIDLMDVSPSQLVSIATGMIPFLEHDDTSRALMGSNMQRQAVPLIRAAAPLLGTGSEPLVARDSGALVLAKNPGVIQSVEGGRIVVRRDQHGPDESAVDIYSLVKYRRSNQGTCISQRPLVFVGDVVKKGDLLADGPSTSYGELALGQNVLVAFMPWQGYNFEDSILINERLIRDDTFTSIHIEEFDCSARDTKLGKEEITRDIPNVSEEALRNLDESGIIVIGAEVKPGDILVGKVTPKGETQLSPEEKLLRAIFGEKAGDVKDTSLRVSTGISGTIIDVQVFTREGTDEDERSKQIRAEALSRIRRDEQTEMDCVREDTIKNLEKILAGAVTTGKLLSEDGTQELLPKDVTLDGKTLRQLPFEMLNFIPLKSELEKKVDETVNLAKTRLQLIRAVYKEKAERLKKGDELSPGMIKMVRVYIAVKRRLSVGDKMAGRHGNKGVISRILPEEDMPFTADGRTVDMVLNPLGVPSRMNIGQILEVMLGWGARGVGDLITAQLERNLDTEVRQTLMKIYKGQTIGDFIEKADVATVRKIAGALKSGLLVSTPVFDGAKESNIHEILDIAKLPKRGQTTLFDGRTGEPFLEDVTIGIMYMLKLHHLVDEKIHARSIGPYSLVTQQPLGGKAQFGGQRLGEMEVWAMEGYGVAYGLQEFLTVKSDDVAGRTRMYEAIVKGENLLEPGIPESFNVLVKELQGLTLDVELLENQQADS